MGMYDNVRCEYPLPDGFDPAGIEFQTKDTDAQYLDTYVIKSDGTLWHEVWDMDIVPESERNPLGFPIFRRVNKRLAPEPFHGALRFYDYTDGILREYVALYDHGRLLKIEACQQPTTPGQEDA